MQDLTQSRLKELLSYDPETGVFVWLVGAKFKGKIAGTDCYGYWQIRINRKNYRAHRLAWLYVYGEFPNADLDHINCVKSDNRIGNLRECSRAQNGFNVGLRIDNKSGFKRVHFYKASGKWQVGITINGKKKHIGYFATAELASAAYEAKARELHGEFYRGAP